MKKDNHLKLFVPTDFFVARMPLLPFDNFYLLNDAIVVKDITLIKKYWKNPIFLNAVYLASKEFYHVALKWLYNDEIVFDPTDGVFQSLYKYYIRMCSRCTPYGLFSGYAFGKIHQGTSSIELKNDNITPFVRADILFLRKLKDYIIKEAKNSDLPLFRNNTIYSFGDMWRYISWNRNYNYEVSEIPKDSILDGILDLAENGTTVSEICTFIHKEVADISQTEIDGYVELLLENNILVDRLPPYMTSQEDPLSELEEYLKLHNYDTKILKPIIDVQNKIDSKFFTSDRTIMDFNNLMSHYRDFVDENYQIFQIDSKVNLKNNAISEHVVQLLAKRSEELFPLISQELQSKMRNFVNRFYRKFETKEVPLVLALDPDYGVGYDYYTSGNLEETPLLDSIYFTFKDGEKDINKVSPLIRYVLNNFINCFSSSTCSPIVLSEEDINNIRPEQNNATPSFGFNGHVSGFFICESQNDLEDSRFKFFPLSTFPTGNVNEILSRFAYHDKNLRENLELITERDSENCIFVELLHHREDRLANVLVRPNFYNYELPYVSESKSDAEHKIPINDIYIRYDNGRIRLRSKRLNKEIKPRYSNAYNYDDNQLPAINFLGDYQYYGINPGFKWDWGFLITNDFLPRVEYKEFILIEARWKIDKDENITVGKLQKIVRDKNLPRLCTYKRSDNVLILDTTNEVCLHILVKLIIKFSIILHEYLQPLKIPNENGEKFVSEFVFPFIFKNGNNHINAPIEEFEEEKERRFLPGEDWSFFKIYASHKYADIIIKEVIRKYIEHFEHSGNHPEWFFIRYYDPDFHIRFRVKSVLTNDSIKFLNELLEGYIEQGVVSSLVIDTYTREIERYGADNIELAELYFHYDSVAISEMLSTESELNETLRWQIAVLSLHMMMADFEVTLEERIQLFEEYFQELLPENVDVSSLFYLKKFKASIDKKYRENREFLDIIIRQNIYKDLNEFVSFFEKRSANTLALIQKVKGNTEHRVRYLSMVKDYVHMNINRIFLTKARMHELVLYFFLHKTYNSIYHRNKKHNSS